MFNFRDLVGPPSLCGNHTYMRPFIYDSLPQNGSTDRSLSALSVTMLSSMVLSISVGQHDLQPAFFHLKRDSSSSPNRHLLHLAIWIVFVGHVLTKCARMDKPGQCGDAARQDDVLYGTRQEYVGRRLEVTWMWIDDTPPQPVCPKLGGLG